MPRGTAVITLVLVLGVLARGGVADEPDNVPRAVAMMYCSGSTWVLSTLKRIIVNTTSVRVEKSLNEILKADKNPLYTPELGEAGAFLALNARAVGRGRALVFKADLPRVRTAPMVQAFKRAGVRLVFAYRANALDFLICGVNDCFQPKEVGIPVFSNGTASSLCFKRREHEKDIAAAGRLLVRLEPRTIVRKLESIRRHALRQRDQLASVGLQISPRVSTLEELAEFTHDRTAVPRCARLFQAVLKEWGFDLPAEAIAAVLQAEAGTRAPPPAHYKKIYNFHRVKEALQAPGVPRELRDMLRNGRKASVVGIRNRTAGRARLSRSR